MIRAIVCSATLGLLGFSACPSEDSIEEASTATTTAAHGELATTADDLAQRYPDGMWLSYTPLSDMKWTLNDPSIADPNITHAQAKDLGLFLNANLFPQINLSVAVLHLDLARNRAGFIMAASNTAILVPWAPPGDLRAVAQWCDAFLTRDRSAVQAIELMSHESTEFESIVGTADAVSRDPLVSPRRRAETLDQLRKQLTIRARELEVLRTTKPAVYERLKGFEKRYDAEVQPLRGRVFNLEQDQLPRLPLMHLELKNKLPAVYEQAWSGRVR